MFQHIYNMVQEVNETKRNVDLFCICLCQRVKVETLGRPGITVLRILDLELLRFYLFQMGFYTPYYLKVHYLTKSSQHGRPLAMEEFWCYNVLIM